MEYEGLQKSQLIEEFFVLQYLYKYQKFIFDLGIKDLICPEERFKQKESWIWLLSKLDGMEKEFFKPYWIPIQKYQYDYFIDMSDYKLPIIEAFFDYFKEPYHWEKKILLESIFMLKIAEENNIDLKQYRINKIKGKYK